MRWTLRNSHQQKYGQIRQHPRFSFRQTSCGKESQLTICFKMGWNHKQEHVHTCTLFLTMCPCNYPCRLQYVLQCMMITIRPPHTNSVPSNCVAQTYQLARLPTSRIQVFCVWRQVWAAIFACSHVQKCLGENITRFHHRTRCKTGWVCLLLLALQSHPPFKLNSPLYEPKHARVNPAIPYLLHHIYHDFFGWLSPS